MGWVWLILGIYITHKLVRLIFRKQNLNKYLLFRSKYLYKLGIKSRLIDKVPDKIVLDSLPTFEGEISGTCYLNDKEYFNGLDFIQYGIQVGNKVVDIRKLPKSYELLKITGELDDIVVQEEMVEQRDTIRSEKETVLEKTVDALRQVEHEGEMVSNVVSSKDAEENDPDGST